MEDVKQKLNRIHVFKKDGIFFMEVKLSSTNIYRTVEDCGGVCTPPISNPRGEQDTEGKTQNGFICIHLSGSAAYLFFIL